MSGNSVNNHKKVEFSEIKASCLVVLEKKPLDNYFKGTRDKKRPKIKSRTSKTFKLSEFNGSQSNEVNFNEVRSFIEEEERSTAEKKLKDKIKEYQKEKEQEERKNHIQQRLKEKNFLLQQENLIETWHGVIKRGTRLKQLDENPDLCSSYFKDQTKYHYRETRQTGISRFSKELWNDDKNDSKKESMEKVTREPGDSSRIISLEHIGMKISEKLVFIDDDTEEEISHVSKRCQQINFLERLN